MSGVRAPTCLVWTGLRRTNGRSKPCKPSALAMSSVRRWTWLETEVAGDHHPLDLVRPFPDLQDLLVPVEPRDRGLLDEAIAPVDLQCLIHDSVRHLARLKLRHRGLLREVTALVLEPRGLVDEVPSGLDLDGHVRELELDRLKARDRLAELLPLLGVAEREVVRALREADAHRRNRDPAAVEDLEELAEPLA